MCPPQYGFLNDEDGFYSGQADSHSFSVWNQKKLRKSKALLTLV